MHRALVPHERGRDLVGLDSQAEQVALADLTACTKEQPTLLGGLHALRDHLGVKGVAQRHDRGDDRDG